MKESTLEFALRVMLQQEGITGWWQECRCHPVRGWRCDFFWPAHMLCVECEGRGRHQTWQGYTDDCEKYNALELLGFTVLRFTAAQINDGSAIRTIREALCLTTAVQSVPATTSGRSRFSTRTRVRKRPENTARSGSKAASAKTAAGSAKRTSSRPSTTGGTSGDDPQA